MGFGWTSSLDCRFQTSGTDWAVYTLLSKQISGLLRRNRPVFRQMTFCLLYRARINYSSQMYSNN